jgi:thioredoxin reductase
MPGFPKVMAKDLVKDLWAQAQMGQPELQLNAKITKLTRKPEGHFELATESGKSFLSKTVMLALGMGAFQPRKVEAPGLAALEGSAVHYVVQALETYKNKDVVIVGGGDSAMEEATFLTRFAKKVYVIHRRDNFRASKIMVDRVLKNPKIQVLWNSAVENVYGDEKGMQGVNLIDLKENKKSNLSVEGLFVAIGHSPNTEIFKGQLEMDENGYLITKGQSSKTSIEGVFAAGDVQDHVYRQAITAAGSGCMAALDAERWLESQHS